MTVNAAALLALGLLLAPLCPQAQAQGFAGLGTEVSGFATPSPETPLDFARDHGPHRDYRIEWWYLTANLTGPDGTAYGAQWTLFRSALRPDDTATAWADHTIWLGHAAVTSAQNHYVAERFARDGIGQAGVTSAPFTAFIDEWHMTSPDASIATLSLSAQGPEFAYALSLHSDAPLVLQGDQGYSVKSASGQASYYYSQPFYGVSGTLTLPSGTVPVTGKAWLDREWSSQPLAADQTGWDWVSLHLDDGAKLMGFRLRDGGDGYTSATYISPDGTPTPYRDGALTLTPLDWTETANRRVPTRWQLNLPDKGISTMVQALNPHAMMTTSVPYWEGPVTLTGPSTGIGYLEMTGY